MYVYVCMLLFDEIIYTHSFCTPSPPTLLPLLSLSLYLPLSLPPFLGSRRCSLPVSSTDYHSSPSSAAVVVSPGSCSTAGHGSSHTPSSGGSLTRYTSLTTPFYRVPLQRQHIAAVHYGFTPSGGTTPTNVNTESPPHGLSSYMPTGSSPQALGFHSNSFNRRRSDNSLQVFARSPPLPFGRLIYQQQHPSPQHPPSHSSPSSSPHSQSASNLCHHKSTSLSPLSTPPSANLPSPVGGSSRTLGHGIKYSLTPHGSGTKLSALTEEAEKGVSSRDRPGSRAPATNTKGKSRPIKDCKPSLCGDFITQSCLLNSDDDDVGGDESDLAGEEEDNFPLSLSMNSSVDSELGQHVPPSPAGAAPKGDSFPSSVHAITFHGNDAVRFTIQSPDHTEERRPASAKEGERSRPNVRRERKLQRASSFSQQHSRQLSNELAHIRQRANSLSAHGDPLDPNFTPASLLVAGAGRELEISPSSEIVPLNKLPFLFSSSTGSRGSTPPSFAGIRTGGRRGRGGGGGTRLLSSSSQKHDVSDPWMKEEESSCLEILRRSYLLGRELLTMARARLGPIMLLSTELVSCVMI